MSNPHKRKKLARLKALMESKVVKEEVVTVIETPVITTPVVVDPVVQEVIKEETVVVEETKQIEELQDTISEVEVKKGKKKKE